MNNPELFGFDWDGDGKVDTIDSLLTLKVLDDLSKPPAPGNSGRGPGCLEYLLGGLFIIALIIALIFYGPVLFVITFIVLPPYVFISLVFIVAALFICFRRYASPDKMAPSLGIGLIGAVCYSLVVSFALITEGYGGSSIESAVEDDVFLVYVSIFLMFLAYSLLGPRIRRADMFFINGFREWLTGLFFTRGKKTQETTEAADEVPADTIKADTRLVFRYPHLLPYAAGILIGLIAAIVISSVMNTPAAGNLTERAASGDLLLSTRYYTLEIPDDDGLIWAYKITELSDGKTNYDRDKNTDNYAVTLYGKIGDQYLPVCDLVMTDSTNREYSWSDLGFLSLKKGSANYYASLMLRSKPTRGYSAGVLPEYLKYRQHIPYIVDSIKPVKNTYLNGSAVHVTFSPEHSGKFSNLRWYNYWENYYRDLLLMK